MSTAPSAVAAQPTPKRGRAKAFIIFFLVLLALAVAGLLYWLHARQFEYTDDAEIDAHIAPVSPRVDGTVTKVHVEDNQIVRVGDPLVDLDPRNFEIALNQALAQLSQARSMVIAEEPNIPITQVENTTNISGGESEVANARAALAAAQRDREADMAKVAEAEANNAKAQADLARYKLLIAKEEVSQQEYDQIVAIAKAQAATVAAAKATLQSAEQTVDGRRAQLEQSQSKLVQYQRNAPRAVAIRRATVQSNRASAEATGTQVEQARLNLSYTKITAPVPGIIMKRSAEVGSHLSAGQQVLQIAQINDVWITANFKETQLQNIRKGQTATIHVDALKRDFDGYVEDIGGSTGAVASVLPPENATGNYVKVVQRIPVRIRLKPNQGGADQLRPGMSVESNVRIGG